VKSAKRKLAGCCVLHILVGGNTEQNEHFFENARKSKQMLMILIPCQCIKNMIVTDSAIAYHEKI